MQSELMPVVPNRLDVVWYDVSPHHPGGPGVGPRLWLALIGERNGQQLYLTEALKDGMFYVYDPVTRQNPGFKTLELAKEHAEDLLP